MTKSGKLNLIAGVMKKACPFFVLLILVLCGSAFGQQQTPTPAASPIQDDEVVRITTNLVQFDVVVVDREGKQVRDLSAADFQVLQDGKPQPITNFSYVNTEAPAKGASGGSSGAVPVNKSSTAGKRVLTFVVDDGNCSATNIGMRASREGIEKFVREQMQPNDLVAIYQTRAGSSMLQQYTGDKAQLLRVAKKIQWRPAYGSCASDRADGSMFEAARTNTVVKQSPLGTTTEVIESGSQRSHREHVEDAQANNQAVGTLGALRYIIQGLRRVPGRKVVFFMSDGITLLSRSGQYLSSRNVLQNLTEMANRSSVVFNTIDPRGTINESMIEARDEIYVQDSLALSDSTSRSRALAVSGSRDGLEYLADETGGKFIHDQNFLDVPIAKALATETGYYLIAYDPADDTFKGKKFNKIEIKVNRPDLKIVSRSGFFGVVEETTTARPKGKTENSDLYAAMTEPLPNAGMDVGLTAYFVNSPETGNVVRALFRISGSDLTFVDDEKEGQKKAVFDVAAVTLDEKNKVVDEFTRAHTYKVQAAAMPTILQNGLIYSTDVIVKKPGIYNFRVAVKDETTKQIGTSSQTIEVPDLKKSHVFVSGLTVAQVDAQGKFAIPATVKPENAVTLTMTAAVPAIRRFRRGSILAYAYTIYNARLDQTTGQPKLTVQTRLYHNGQLVIDGKPQDAQLDSKQLDWTRIGDFGYLQLKPQMEPGDYTLQITITDLLDKGKSAVTNQSVDFEVVE